MFLKYKNFCYNVFSVLSHPKQIKTNNAPSYASKTLAQFLKTFQIHHKFSIPYNPQSQGIVKQANQTLKNYIYKIKKGGLGALTHSPQNNISHVLLILNFLILDDNQTTAAQRLWEVSNKEKTHPLVFFGRMSSQKNKKVPTLY